MPNRPSTKTVTRGACEQCGTPFAVTAEQTINVDYGMAAFFCRRCVIEDGMPDLPTGMTPVIAPREADKNQVPNTEWIDFKKAFEL